jgi:hypothetical protein
VSASQHYEVVVSRNGQPSEWWCVRASDPKTAATRLWLHRTNANPSEPAFVNTIKASGVVFREVPKDSPDVHCITRRES